MVKQCLWALNPALVFEDPVSNAYAAARAAPKQATVICEPPSDQFRKVPFATCFYSLVLTAPSDGSLQALQVQVVVRKVHPRLPLQVRSLPVASGPTAPCCVLLSCHHHAQVSNIACLRAVQARSLS